MKRLVYLKILICCKNLCSGYVSKVKISASADRLFSSHTSGAQSILNFSGKTVHELYHEALNLFAKFGIPEPDYSSRYLICDAASIGYSYSDFSKNLNEILTVDEIDIFKCHVQERLLRKPVQYIIGNWDFYGFRFAIKPPILIPRPETEELVEHVATKYRQRSNQFQLRILEVGTGTGVIPISLLKALPNATAVAIDINPVSVTLAQENAANILGIDYKRRLTIVGSSFESFHKLWRPIPAMIYKRATRAVDDISNSTNSKTNKLVDEPGFDVIISNPPYIPTSELRSLEPEVLLYEDGTALDGGEDGLDLIREIILHGPKLFRKPNSTPDTTPDGCDFVNHYRNDDDVREIWMEVADGHPELIITWLHDNYNYSSSSNNSNKQHILSKSRSRFAEVLGEEKVQSAHGESGTSCDLERETRTTPSLIFHGFLLERVEAIKDLSQRSRFVRLLYSPCPS